MEVAITGGSGFVGSHLGRFLLSEGHKVTAIGNRANYRLIEHERFTYVSADTAQPGDWQNAIAGADSCL